jgi:hypothetical protein
MDVKAVKLELVQRILETNEQGILEQVRLILERSAGDWWDLIDEEEKKAIEEGIAQLNAGQSTLHEEVIKRARNKFNTQK